MSARDAIFKRLLVHNRLTTYVALQELNFNWVKDELCLVIDMWNEGKSIFVIAAQLSRDIDELALLLMDLGDRELIRGRDRGILRSSPLREDLMLRKNIRMFCTYHKHGYTVYEDENFIFDEKEAVEFDGWWNQNLSIQEIADLLNRKSSKDILFLMMDRSRKGTITSRQVTVDGRMLKEYVCKPICIVN